MDRVLAILATLAAGALIAFQPPANADLAKYVGALGATLVSLLVATAIVLVLLLVIGDPGQLRDGLSSMRPVHVIGGVAGAAIVGVSLVAVDRLGAGGVVAATVCTQLVVSAVLDRAGAFNLDPTPFTPLRLAGIALLIAGTLALTAE